MKKRLQNMEAQAEENLTTLRTQYENQIDNIRKLRQLYEERAEAAERGHRKEIEKERAKNLLLELKLDDYTKDATTKQELNEKIEEFEKQLAEKETETDELRSERSSLMAECNNLTAQLSLINNLFSNMLTGEMDFDMLTQLLQDNHNLITDLIANGDINDTASLLVNIAEKAYKKPSESSDQSPLTLSAKEEIASNLPKVWRMLIELLSSHENCSQVQGTSDECYKHVKTPSGSRTVISVSQTFLRLKDLILEKNSLVKEVGRLKTLNGHLEHRLDQQEKRLSVVTSELRKTWGVVSKLKVQHRQLHTHEKVLRYELQHKRQMLTDLKHELEYCRETWDKAREKNKETEHDWEILRKEFALRKSRDASNSAESGYEDDENSQSPDVSSSELEYDLSPLSDGGQKLELDAEMEDAASDATVIELIDMLEFDQDDVTYDVPRSDSVAEEISTEASTSSGTQMISEFSDDSKVEEPEPAAEPRPVRTPEEILEARAARLRRLEQQCRSLLNQMALTSLRSDTLSTRLEELHEQYGSEERRSLPRQNAEAEMETETETQVGGGEESSTGGDSRSDRLQKMEQNCMQMFENVSSDEAVELRLENVDVASTSERGVVGCDIAEAAASDETVELKLEEVEDFGSTSEHGTEGAGCDIAEAVVSVATDDKTELSGES